MLNDYPLQCLQCGYIHHTTSDMVPGDSRFCKMCYAQEKIVRFSVSLEKEGFHYNFLKIREMWEISPSVFNSYFGMNEEPRISIIYLKVFGGDTTYNSYE